MSAVWVDKPPTFPSLLRMTGLAAFCELANVRISMTIRANSTDVVEDKLRFLAGIRLRCVTSLTWCLGVLTIKSEFAVAIMNEKQVGYLPALKRMAFRTFSRSCVSVGIRMTIGASIKIQADVLSTLMHVAGVLLKMALFT